MGSITPVMAELVEYHVNNPNATVKQMADLFNLNLSKVSHTLTRYYKRPDFNIYMESAIDSERAIYQESVLSIVHSHKLICTK